MSFTSYAQNFEDVMLWRALKHVREGRYIDAGAQDPVVDSVSLAFHERGWQGIHVEPTARYAEALRAARPGDRVIQAAIADAAGVIAFFEIPGTGISTASEQIAVRHRVAGFDVREISVPSLPLSAVLQLCAGTEVHWLKLDIEGFEANALRSWGDSPVRPWIVVVESTAPLTQNDLSGEWEPVLVSYGYEPVYFDGLNRFYVSDAHPELKPAFDAPPNVFDDFALNGTSNAPFSRLVSKRLTDRLQEASEQAQRHALDVAEQIQSLTSEVAAARSLVDETRANAAQERSDLATNHRQHDAALQQHIAGQNAEIERLRAESRMRAAELAAENARALQALREEHATALAQFVQRVHALEKEVIEKDSDISSRRAAESTQLARLAELEQLHHRLTGEMLRERAEWQERLGAEQLAAAGVRGEIQRAHEAHRAKADLLGREIELLQQALEAAKSDILEVRGEARTQELRLLRGFERERRRVESIHQSREQHLARKLDVLARLRARDRRQCEMRSLLARQQAHRERDTLAAEVRHAQEEGQLARTAGEALAASLARAQQELEHAERARQNLESRLQQTENKRLDEIAAREALATRLRQAQLDADRTAQALSQAHEHESSKLREVHGAEIALQAHRLEEVEAQLGGRLADLRAALKLEQEACSAALDEIRSIHASWAWRLLLAPFRGEPQARKPRAALHAGSPGAPLGGHLPAVTNRHGDTMNTSREPSPPPSPPDPGAPIVVESGSPPATIAHQHTEMVPTTLADLLDLHDVDFVHHAYLSLLGRAADGHGSSHYVRLLRQGAPKMQVVADLTFSPEGKQFGSRLQGLQTELTKYRRSRLPLLGGVYRRVYRQDGRSPLEARVRAIENRVIRLSHDNETRCRAIETSLLELRAHALRSSAPAAQAATAAPTPQSATAALKTSHADARMVDQLSTRAREIYIRLLAEAPAHGSKPRKD